MPKPLSIAMAFSIAINLGVLLAIDWLLRDDAVPSISSALMLVKIEPTPSIGEMADDSRVVPEAASEAGDAGQSRTASRASETPSETVQATESLVAAEVLPSDSTSMSAPAPAPQDAAVDPADTEATTSIAAVVPNMVATPVPVVTTTALAESTTGAAAPAVEQPTLIQADLSAKQQKMLNRKLREWTEELHEIPDLASGLTWEHKGQEYLARFTQLPSGDDMGIERVIVEISTEAEGRRLSSEVQLKRLAFSNYAQFVNRWDPNVEIHDDELDGRFHSNTAINLLYDRTAKPVFHGKVTTTSRDVNMTGRRGRSNREQIFVGGLQTGVRAIRLPKRFLPFPNEADERGDHVHRFAEDTRITFYRDGSFVWQTVGSDAPPYVAAISEETTYLIADRKVKLFVRGKVNGKVLIYSPERIVIEDDLVYAQDPETESDADDYLGIVSDKYVDIAPPAITGTGDLYIQAAIYAKRRFAVRNYRARESGVLSLYGSLSAGSISATEPRYATSIRFDRRLEGLRPPGFPLTDRYEVESWDANWTVEPIEGPL